MSHEPTRKNCPTDAELFAAKNRPGSLIDQIAAANAIRDKRIRDEALEEAARATDRVGPRVSGDTIRALKDKEPNHE